MNTIFQALSTAKQASQYALDQSGRIPYPILSIVANNADPDNERRVRAVDPACPQLETYWLRRLQATFIDEPLPPVGATIVVWFIDGVPTNGWYMPVQNATNKPLEKEDPLKDYREQIPGEYISEVGGSRTERTLITHKVSAGQDIRIELDNGSYFDMKLSGEVKCFNPIGAGFIVDPAGQINLFCTNINILPLLGQSGTTTPLNLGGRTLNITNGSLQMTDISSASIEGKQIATVDAVDSDSDVLITKGWS